MDLKTVSKYYAIQDSQIYEYSRFNGHSHVQGVALQLYASRPEAVVAVVSAAFFVVVADVAVAVVAVAAFAVAAVATRLIAVAVSAVVSAADVVAAAFAVAAFAAAAFAVAAVPANFAVAVTM